jgi:hypothetical protein
MKYRAVAIGLVKDGHPVQNLSNSLETVELWAKKTHESDGVPVEIYIREETLLRTENGVG